MLALRKSIHDRTIFLHLAMITALATALFAGLTCIGSAYPSFHADLTSAIISPLSANTPTTFSLVAEKKFEEKKTAAEALHPPLGLPAKKVDNLPDPGDLPFELKHDTLRLVSKDGSHVAEITVVNGGLIISVADLKAKVVRHQPIVLVAAPPQPARPDDDTPDTFDLKEEPKVTLTPPQRSLLYEP